MKNFLLFIVVVVLVVTGVAAIAQGAIYRCGNEYLNDVALAVARGCQVVVGGNVTVVPGTSVNTVEKGASSPPVAIVPTRSVRSNIAANASPNTDALAQRARDSDARSILLAELKTAEIRLADLSVGADVELEHEVELSWVE